jgi:hypothetical protein
MTNAFKAAAIKSEQLCDKYHSKLGRRTRFSDW